MHSQGGQGGAAPYPVTLPAAVAFQQQSTHMEVMGPGLLILLLWPQLPVLHSHAAHRQGHGEMGPQKLCVPPICNPMAMATRAGSSSVCHSPGVPGCSSLRARVWCSPCRGHTALLRVKRADDSAKEHHPPHPFWGALGLSVQGNLPAAPGSAPLLAQGPLLLQPPGQELWCRRLLARNSRIGPAGYLGGEEKSDASLPAERSSLPSSSR